MLLFHMHAARARSSVQQRSLVPSPVSCVQSCIHTHSIIQLTISLSIPLCMFRSESEEADDVRESLRQIADESQETIKAVKTLLDA